jgi:acyl dehydratase
VTEGLRTFEDFSVGEVVDLGTAPPITEEAIVDFARQWDPQPFHVDPVRAKESMFGGLVASGWHTAAVAMRLLVDNLLAHTSAGGSPGLDRVRFLRPVRPGDVLSGTFTVVDLSVSERRPSMGTVHSLLEMRNQHGEVVLAIESRTFLDRKVPPSSGSAG